MIQIVTTGIILSRVNFGEADKIIVVLTPDYGKLSIMARGVRKIKSKLAGGVELFSVSELTYIKGRGDIGTLVSSRLQTYFGDIIADYTRTMVGYELLKFINKTTKEDCEEDFYRLLLHSLTLLNNKDIEPLLIKCWTMVNLLKISGHTPNLQTDIAGNKLNDKQSYDFDYQDMGFYNQASGKYVAGHIKSLRLLLQNDPIKLHLIKGLNDKLIDLDNLLTNCIKQYY